LKPIVTLWTSAGGGAAAGRVAAVGGDDRIEHRVVGGQPGDPHGAPLEVPRPANGGPRDHRCQRALDDRHHADHVETMLARDRKVVDVQDRELNRSRLQQLGGVRRRRGLLDVEIGAGLLVVALMQRRVDPGVDGVRLEVENEGRSLGSARFSTASAGRERGRADGGRQQRDDLLHRSPQDSSPPPSSLAARQCLR
jgi:hypothetical protein